MSPVMGLSLHGILWNSSSAGNDRASSFEHDYSLWKLLMKTDSGQKKMRVSGNGILWFNAIDIPY